MADKDVMTPTTVKLTGEQATRLKQNQANLSTLKDSLTALKRLGMDTSAIEQQIEYADNVSTELLKSFT